MSAKSIRSPNRLKPGLQTPDARVRDREGLESRLQPAVVGKQRPMPKSGRRRRMRRTSGLKTERLH